MTKKETKDEIKGTIVFVLYILLIGILIGIVVGHQLGLNYKRSVDIDLCLSTAFDAQTKCQKYIDETQFDAIKKMDQFCKGSKEE